MLSSLFTLQNHESSTTIVVRGILLLVMVGFGTVHEFLRRRRGRRVPHHHKPLVVGVFGAGAVGTVAGLKLLHSNQIRRVVLIGRSTLLEEVNRAGHRMTLLENFHGGINETFFVDDDRLQVVDGTQPHALECLLDCDVILVSTKTVDTSHVAADLARILPSNSTATIILLQNGLDNLSVLREYIRQENYPNIRILQAVVAFPAEWQARSTKFHINLRGGKIMVGNCNQALHRLRVQTLVQSWTKARLSSGEWSRIVLLKHIKLLSNLINPINALAGLTIPSQMIDRGYRVLLAMAMTEAASVLGQYDPTLQESMVDRWLFQITGGFIMPMLLTRLPDSLYRHQFGASAQEDPSAFGSCYKSSTLQDIERCRPKTEIDELCGLTVHYGRIHGIATPVHLTLMELIKEAERAQAGSPKLGSAELLQMVDRKRQQINEKDSINSK